MEWYIFAFISAFFSAVAAILEKKTLFKAGALEFSTILAIFNMILAIPFFFQLNYPALSQIAIGVLFFKSILGAFAFLCVMYGIKNLELSGALPLLVLTPGLVAVVAFIFLREVLSFYEISGMILLLVGTYILQVPQEKGLFEPFLVFYRSKGHHFIIIALLLFTTTSTLDKLILGKFKLPPDAVMGFQHLFLAIIFIIIFFIQKKNLTIASETIKTSGKLILLISILTIIYRYAQFEAIKLGSVALVLSIKRISVFFATIVGGKIFKEGHLLRKAISAALMVTGSVLVIMF